MCDCFGSFIDAKHKEKDLDDVVKALEIRKLWMLPEYLRYQQRELSFPLVQLLI